MKDTPTNSEGLISMHHDDPSTSTDGPIDRLEKTARIRRGPFQPQIKSYPVKTIGTGKSARKRSFSSSWYNDYKWIEYSIEKDAAFCFPCRYFAMNDNSSGTIKDAFISTGFSAWNRANEVFKKHEGSKCHISSIVGWDSFIKSKDVDLQLNEAKEVELKEKEKQRLKNCAYMERLIDIIKTLSKGGKPLRGHDEFEGSAERGLFLECVSLLKKYDIFFKSYIDNAPENCTYLSNRIQNDILQSLTNVMLRTIADSARGQPLSIIADETSDLSNHEQLSFVLRFIPRNEVTPVERFVTLERLMRTDAESIFNSLNKILDRMEISWENVVSVCFDGASTMAGHTTGVQARCKGMNESILFVHCYAHCLNLALVNSCTLRNENPVICDFFGALQLVYSFIEGSPKRHCVFEEICKKTDQKLHTLKSLSDTRWACRAEAVTVIRTHYESVVQAIENILDDRTTQPKTRAKAIGILHQIKSFNFIVCLEIMHVVLQIVLITSKTLQNTDVDLCEAIDTVENLAVALVELRNDESKFEEIYAEARETCENIGIEIPQPKRRKVSSKTGDENPESAFYVASKKEEIRLFTFHPVLDRMIEGINDRFSQETKEVINVVGKAMKLNLGHEKCSKEDFDKVSKQFGLDSSELQAEFLLLKAKKDLNYPPKNVLKWLEWFNVNQRFQTFKTFKELLEKFATIPISSCSCERSFSKMTIVKTKLRSTMKQDRLQNLMLPFVEQQLAVDVNSENIIEEFKRIVPFSRRMIL